jgi:hypothetical protein
MDVHATGFSKFQKCYKPGDDAPALKGLTPRPGFANQEAQEIQGKPRKIFAAPGLCFCQKTQCITVA